MHVKKLAPSVNAAVHDWRNLWRESIKKKLQMNNTFNKISCIYIKKNYHFASFQINGFPNLDWRGYDLIISNELREEIRKLLRYSVNAVSPFN